MRERPVIAGAGPAGASAAIALARLGRPPILYERSAVPRHKVCGEFLTPEIAPLLDDLGVGATFRQAGPARITHAELHFGRAGRRFRLGEPAYGLSRYRFDAMLVDAAVSQGAVLRNQLSPATPAIDARGRRSRARRGGRLFGFKAHFDGPANDAVELWFFEGGYCGLCPVEAGATNVCGLASEELLAAHDFQVEEMLAAAPHLRTRMSGISRRFDWLTTGPLRFGRGPATTTLAVGDALRFVDPFTGSGLLASVQTGVWAAEAFAGDRKAYARRCAAFYRTQSAASAIIRRLLALGWAETLAGLIPARLLFRLTRPAA
jgi:flavin-dependent dehydrogenase